MIDNLSLGLRCLWSFLCPSYSYVILFVTARCNARCNTCFYWERIEDANNHNELTWEEYDQTARSMNWILYLSIGGGEPFLRKDLSKIIHSFCQHSGARFVNISTNCLLHDSTMRQVSEMLDQNPKLRVKITLSIDDVGKRHDIIRAVPGNWDKCIQLHDQLVELREQNPRLSIEIGSTFCSYNEDTAFALIDYVADHLKADDHTFTYVRGDAKDPQAARTNLQKYESAMDYLKNRRKQGGAHGLSGIFGAIAKTMYQVNQETIQHDRMVTPCVAGNKLITIDERGAVRPCEVLWYDHGGKFDVGDLRENGYDLDKIRKSVASSSVRSFIKKTECHCSFECANLCNVVYSPKLYPKVLRHWFSK